MASIVAGASVSSSAGGGDGSIDVSWTEPRRRPRPPTIQGSSIDVARESGAATTHGTFGRASRFSSTKTPYCNHSPRGEGYYHRNVMHTLPMHSGKKPTQGIGNRKSMEAMPLSRPQVGPGTYHGHKGSVTKKKSPLDGRDYCDGSMHKVLPPADVHNGLQHSPGPHHRVNVVRDLDHRCPKYYKEPFATKGGRHELKEEDSPGPGQYDQTARTLAVTTSCPNLKNSSAQDGAPVGGSKKNLKCTFGMSDRFGNGRKSNTPDGELYYSHSSFPTADEYLAMSKSCGFGGDKKVDFGNPLRLHKSHRLQVCAVTYTPDTSAGKKASSLDGFVKRWASPIAEAGRQKREMLSTMRSTSSIGKFSVASSPPAQLAATARPHARSNVAASAADTQDAGGRAFASDMQEDGENAAFFMTEG